MKALKTPTLSPRCSPYPQINPPPRINPHATIFFYNKPPMELNRFLWKGWKWHNIWIRHWVGNENHCISLRAPVFSLILRMCDVKKSLKIWNRIEMPANIWSSIMALWCKSQEWELLIITFQLIIINLLERTRLSFCPHDTHSFCDQAHSMVLQF